MWFIPLIQLRKLSYKDIDMVDSFKFGWIYQEYATLTSFKYRKTFQLV